jgi:hypothetical protein
MAYSYGTDVGEGQVIDVTGSLDSPVIKRFENINTNYGKEGIGQVPFSLSIPGPSSLKFRGDAYKVTEGEGNV